MTASANVSPTIRASYLLEDGQLARWVWPGGYPLVYLDSQNNVLCPPCASDNDEYDAMIVAAEINWEDTALHCDHCSNQIEAAYGE